MKKILGLDVGTNSIGWALVDHDFENKDGHIIDMGVRVIPMDQGEIGDFNKGNLQSSTANRRGFRGVRRLRERQLNRRERLLRVLKYMGYVDTNYEVNHEQSFAYERHEGKRRFRFQESYAEMKAFFLSTHPQLKSVSHDWTIYYLRKKALTRKITKEELAWVILQFNAKRGYFQLRGDTDLNTDANKYFISDRVIEVIDLGEKKGKNGKYQIVLDGGVSGVVLQRESPRWVGLIKDFIITEKQTKDGKSVSLSAPDDTDWTLRKKKIEHAITNGQKTVGHYIFSLLLKDPQIKIRGQEVHTIDRRFYKEELAAIIEKQTEYHLEFNDKVLLIELAKLLYKRNIPHQKNLASTSLSHLFVNDIIYYQRPLKSKKHLISNCKYESYRYTQEGELKEKPIKGVAKSHPLFQEFRIWSVIHNIKVYALEARDEQGILHYDVDETPIHLDVAGKEKIYALLDSKASVSTNQLLKAIGLNDKSHRLNYEKDTKFKGNETKSEIYKAIKGIKNESEVAALLDQSGKLQRIWHALYSLGENENYLKAALSHGHIDIGEEAIEAIVKKVKPYQKSYAAYSRKAIVKFLSLMRVGIYWDEKEIDAHTRKRIEYIVNAEVHEDINERVRSILQDHTDINLESIIDAQGLPEYVASYIIYNRHSEIQDIRLYSKPEDIDVQRLIPQHSLRNPTVEKILRETMLVVRDIWTAHGKPDKIHVEMARELKLSNDQRSAYTQRRNNNRRVNDRAKVMLRELKKEYSSVNPFSIGHQELFKLYEEGAAQYAGTIDDEIKAIRKKDDPTSSELQRYKLWLDQKYKSPYTGQPIPLSALFTTAYEVEHVIPKSLYYDNSFNNKIICEREANKLKDNQTAYQFIISHAGSELKNGRTILLQDQYEDLVRKMFWQNKSKQKNLMSIGIPESFITRQLNDTRYISKKLLGLLDPIVRDNQDDESRSRHILPMVGGITHQLKRDWGLHDVWKQLLSPRFERMNELTGTIDFYKKKNGKIHLSGNETDLKRLDHRHHALDALIIACTSRQHVQYLNSLNNDRVKYNLEPKLIRKSKNGVKDRHYIKPWEAITTDAKKRLDKIIISFKQNLRVINRSKNYYQKYVQQSDGTYKKGYVKQKSNPDYWSVRRPIHQETVHGRIQLREYKQVRLTSTLNDIDMIADPIIRRDLKKRWKECGQDFKALKKDLKNNPIKNGDDIIKQVDVIVYNNDVSATRKVLGEGFDAKKIAKVVSPVTREILTDHLDKYDGKTDLAFGVNGLIDLNKDRRLPIKKVRVMEDLGEKFTKGSTGVKSKQYVVAAKGSNLYFVIYRHDDTGDHLITKESSISFSDVMQQQKSGESIIEEREGYRAFTLSPLDIVYVIDEGEDKILPDKLDIDRIYKCVSFTKHQCLYIQNVVAAPIVNKKEFSALNKQEKSIDGTMIKSNCVKLKVNRLGKITGHI